MGILFLSLPHITPAFPVQLAVPAAAIQESKHPTSGGHFYNRPQKTFLIITFPHFTVYFYKIYQPLLGLTRDSVRGNGLTELHLLTHFFHVGCSVLQ